MAGAVGGNLVHHVDVEIGPTLYYRLGEFGDLAVQSLIAGAAFVFNGMEVTGTDTTTAAHTEIVIYPGFFIDVKQNSILVTEFGTALTAGTHILINRGLTIVVHDHLAAPAAASHAEIFERPAEPGILVALKVIQGDNNVGVHNRPAYLRRFAVDPAGDWRIHIIGTLESVGNDVLTPRGQG